MPKHKKDQAWDGCPIRFGMGIFGDKWTLLIVRDLMFKGKTHYGDFADSQEQIATNILADRLRMLVEKGVVHKERDTDNRTRYVYRLTDKGKALLPVMLAIVDWAQRYDPNTEVPRSFIRKLRRNPEALQAEILEALA